MTNAYPTAPETVGPARMHRLELSEPAESRLDWLMGILTRHDELFNKNDQQQAAVGAGLAAGTRIFDNVPLKGNLRARSLIVDNPTGYTLFVESAGRFVPPASFGFVVNNWPATDALRISVFAGTSVGAQTVNVIATEAVLQPTALGAIGGSALPAGAVQLAAGSALVGATSPRGAASVNYFQQTSTAAAATLLAARPTRQTARIRNTDAANSVWVGPPTVTIANGAVIKPNEVYFYPAQVLLQVIDNGAHAVLDISDFFD